MRSLKVITKPENVLEQGAEEETVVYKREAVTRGCKKFHNEEFMIGQILLE